MSRLILRRMQQHGPRPSNVTYGAAQTLELCHSRQLDPSSCQVLDALSRGSAWSLEFLGFL